MKRASYRHIGGAVISDHGVIPLRRARDLIAFYASESSDRRDAGDTRTAQVCADRALDLSKALEGAERWRRAAGWCVPDAADDHRAPAREA